MRDQLEKNYNLMKDLRIELANKRLKYERNNNAFQGNVPKKYQKAFKELGDSIKRLESRIAALEDINDKYEDLYIFLTISGNLLFLKDDVNAQPFLDKVEALKQREWAKLTHAAKNFDIDELDNVLTPLRKEFVDEMFGQYIEYSKTIAEKLSPATVV